MWRRILGVLVGWVAGGSAAVALFFVLFFILKKEGMLEADGTMTGLWIGVSLVLSLATSYLAGTIARLIGKDKLTTFIFLGVTVLFAAYGVISAMMAGTPEPPAVQKGTPQWAIDMGEVGLAYSTAPIWFTILNPILNLLGVAFGGFSKGDFDKAPQQPLAD